MVLMRGHARARRPVEPEASWRGGSRARRPTRDRSAVIRWRTLALGMAGLLAASAAAGQGSCPPSDPYDSGGVLDPDEAVYDVRFYDLALTVLPAERRIRGSLAMHATMTAPAARVAFDLDPLLEIETVTLAGSAAPLRFVRCGGRTRVDLPRRLAAGEALALQVAYGGAPRVAPRPPWDGGFQWERTASGEPWIATSNQMLGADVWWPVKDHVSDKPDSMSIRVTAPASLVVATNGRLRGVEDAPGGQRTWRWFVSTPISTYNVALNIAPYRTLETTIASVAGDSIPVVFFVLPEDYEKGRKLFPEILEHLRWFERRFGPYAFRADKYGVAQTPHLGMEHQTIIAYGAKFDNRSMTGGTDWGFDALHHHELAHEWWGNLVTNADWKDMWLHEGFGSYMQYLYLEDTQGVERARAFLRGGERGIGNRKPVAPREVTSAQAIYDGHDIYAKGSRALHALRWLIGDEAFFRALRRMAYPDPALEKTTDGRAVRLAETSDFLAIAEAEGGRELDWFFDVYLRSAALPALLAAESGGTVTLQWQAPGGLPFPMPIEVAVNGARSRVELRDGRATLRIPEGARLEFDPDGWVLRAR